RRSTQPPSGGFFVRGWGGAAFAGMHRCAGWAASLRRPNVQAFTSTGQRFLNPESPFAKPAELFANTAGLHPNPVLTFRKPNVLFANADCAQASSTFA
ncbi:MAG: hypothetical protein ACREP7_13475, partial [Lysobacter sp.]